MRALARSYSADYDQRAPRKALALYAPPIIRTALLTYRSGGGAGLDADGGPGGASGPACLPWSTDGGALGPTDGVGARGTRLSPSTTATRFVPPWAASSSSSSERLRRRVPFLGLTAPGMVAAARRGRAREIDSEVTVTASECGQAGRCAAAVWCEAGHRRERMCYAPTQPAHHCFRVDGWGTKEACFRPHTSHFCSLRLIASGCERLCLCDSLRGTDARVGQPVHHQNTRACGARARER